MTHDELVKKVKRSGFWYADADTLITLNADSPWEAPLTNVDDGGVCQLRWSAYNLGVEWHWRGNGYDEHYLFPGTPGIRSAYQQWKRWYMRFMSQGSEALDSIEEYGGMRLV